MPHADLAAQSEKISDRPLIAGGWMDPLTFVKTFYIKLNHDECPMMASSMAFGFMGAMIPSLIFLISVLGIIGRQNDMVPMMFNAVNHFAPQNAIALIKETIDGILQSSNKGLGILGMLVAIWSASRGAAVIVKGLDKAYNIPLEKRPFWHEPVMSLLIVLTLGLILIIASNLIFFGDPIMNWVLNFFNLPLDSKILLQVARFGIGILSVIAFSTFIYGILLKVKLKDYYWRASFIGSIVFTVIWFGISLLFSLYIQYFHSYNPIYGSLGGVVLLLTWLYLSALSILIAGEVISILAIPKEATEIAADSHH